MRGSNVVVTSQWGLSATGGWEEFQGRPQSPPSTAVDIHADQLRETISLPELHPFTVNQPCEAAYLLCHM